MPLPEGLDYIDSALEGYMGLMPTYQPRPGGDYYESILGFR